MDCEKFETTLIDELYDELDELTSAAAKRHVAGCARCAGIFSGLKATRRIAVLPMVSPSADLEERILAAAKDAQKVVPIERRLSRAISWAGSWAMRPQTAMAALFLLMIGASSLLLRGTRASAPSTATMTITAEGTPVGQAPPVPAEQIAKVDPTAAAAAHGVLVPPAATPVPVATAMASAVAANTPAAPGPLDLAASTSSGPGRKDDDGVGALAQNGPRAKSAYGSVGGGGAPGGGIMNAEAPAGAPAAHYSPKPVAISASPPPSTGASDPMAQADEAKKERWTQAPAASASPYDSALALYRAGNFDAAVQAFDALGPANAEAALGAARSVRDGSGGCSPAIPRFDAVATRSFGTRVGYDAVLEGGQCLRQVGSIEMARSHFARLLTVPSYANRAQVAIDSLSQGQVAARRAAPAPAKAPAAADATAAPPAQQQAPARPSQQVPNQKSVSY